ncbi:MAG: RNA polymerase sigma factor [Spirochaetales bacterium]|nr:RNA polymerase sigma factor [Spirochaetales bacterium]
MVRLKDKDEKLIAQCLRGSLKAFEEIIKRHQKKVFLLGQKFFHNFEQAEDFTQEVFLKVMEKLSTFSGKSSFVAWLYRVAYNHAVSKYYLNRKELLLGQDFPDENDVADSSQSPENLLSKKELKEQTQNALKKLPDIYNIVIRMHYFDGLPYMEISEILEMPLNTVKSYVFRAKKMIKEHLSVEKINYFYKDRWAYGER